MNVTHDNGYITVYAHLNKFSPELEKKALEVQYQRESDRIDFFPKKLEFPVKKGEIIAFSGNSGFSVAPHLHFEIRDEKNRQLNPLQFGFQEVIDSAPPIFQNIRVIPKSPKTLINGKNQPQDFRCYKNSNGIDVINDTLRVHGPFGLEFRAFDKMSGNWNKTGIQGYRLTLDGKEIFEANINSLPVLLTRFINLHVDFERLINRSLWYQRIYKESGNLLPFYKSDGSEGIIKLQDDAPHTIDLELEDALGNISRATVIAQKEKMNTQVIQLSEN